jgi:hypothetical protein
MTMLTEESPKNQALLEVSEKSSAEEVTTTAQQTGRPNTDEQLGPKNDNNSRTSAQEGGALDSESATPAPQYPKAWELFVIVAALCLAVFLVALDQTIVAVAVPKITDHFRSLDDVGWSVYNQPVHLDRSLMSTGMALHICSPELRYSPALDEFMLSLMYVNCIE